MEDLRSDSGALVTTTTQTQKTVSEERILDLQPRVQRKKKSAAKTRTENVARYAVPWHATTRAMGGGWFCAIRNPCKIRKESYKALPLKNGWLHSGMRMQMQVNATYIRSSIGSLCAIELGA